MMKQLILSVLLLAPACGMLGASTDHLEGTRWTFTSIDGAPPVSSKAGLTIDRGRIGANVGCNGMGGDLRIEHGRLMIGPVMQTEMYCDGIMEQERIVGELLTASPAYKVRGDTLQLEGGGHKAELKRAR